VLVDQPPLYASCPPAGSFAYPYEPDGNRIESCNAETRLLLARAAACQLDLAERARARRGGVRVSGPAGPHEVWHEPGAQRLRKASATVPVSGSMSWLAAAIPSSSWCGSASGVPLENRARVSHLRRPARPAQQRRAGLCLQAPQSSTPSPFRARADPGRPRETLRSEVTA
jgi:hypothetical protein